MWLNQYLVAAAVVVPIHVHICITFLFACIYMLCLFEKVVDLFQDLLAMLSCLEQLKIISRCKEKINSLQVATDIVSVDAPWKKHIK